MVRAVIAEIGGARICAECPMCDCRDADGTIATELGGDLGWLLGKSGAN
eukprot:gene17559-3260_t